MAGTSVTSAHALAQTAYRTGLILEAETRALMMALAGTDPDSVFVIEDRPGAQRGSTLKIRFQAKNYAPRAKTRAAQIIGDEGTDNWHENDIGIKYFSLADRALENAVDDQNNVSFDLRESGQIGMAMDAATILECSLMHQVAGYSPVNATAYANKNYDVSGGNAVIEPDAAHHFFFDDASAANTSEADVAVDATAVPTTRFIQQKLALLQSRNHTLWPMSPAMTPWGKGYVYLDSLDAINTLRENSPDSDVYDLSRACIEGGMPIENAAIWTGEGFKVGNVIYLATDYATLGTSGSSAGSTTAGSALSNVQRGVLLGARAGHVMYGEGFVEGNHLGYTEFIAHRRLSMQTDTVWGVKVNVVNGQRWGSAVFSHYSPATTSNTRYV
jgi:hypothetical protein